MTDNSTLLGVGSRVNHPSYGDGVVTRLNKVAYEVCFTEHGVKDIGKTYDAWEVIEQIPTKEAITISDAERAVENVLKRWSESTTVVELGHKWDGGMMILKPGEEHLKSKEIPIDVFFNKIVMVRDRLRVMEQRVNSSNISNEEKVNLQQYITRIYGSLTTFNVLFQKKEDHFKGAGSK